MDKTLPKPFLEELKQFCVTEAQEKLSQLDTVWKLQVPTKPIFDLSYQLITDLNLPVDTKIDEVEEEIWNWVSHLFHKGIAAAIAFRYRREQIRLVYSLEDAKAGKRPSYSSVLVPIEGEYSFNLRYHLFRFDPLLEDFYYNIIDFIKEHQSEIDKQDIQFNELLMVFLSFAGCLGVEFTNRIDLTKEDYWPIRSSFINLKKELDDESDLIEIDRLGEFEAPVTEVDSQYHVECSYCGTPALIFPGTGDVWGEASLDPCEHFAFAFITNTNNYLYGKEYYRKSLKRAVVNYVESFKGYTCSSNPEAFINDFLNGDTDLKENEIDYIVKIMKSNLPDCSIQIKQFEKILNGEKHVFHFHFMKLLPVTESETAQI